MIAKSLAAEATREIERLLGADATQTLGDFEAAETAVRTAVLAVAARFVAERLNADHSDQHAAGLPCRCGHTARYAGRRAKTIHTALGAMTLQRAYYHCASCRTGFCPRDRTLGIDETTLSPAATRMTAAAARVRFKEASTLLDELAGLAVDPKQVERTAEALGRAIATDERQAVEPEAHRVKPTLYLGMDGTGIPVRKAETAQRQGKQPDGSAKTREVKLAVAWTAERRHPKTGIAMRDPDSVSYTAAIETAASRDTDREPSPFAQRVCREAERRRFADADRRVILGDGAPWIWALADECFPDAIQIVDIFHAKSHLWGRRQGHLHTRVRTRRAVGETTTGRTRCRPHQRPRRRPRPPRPNLRRGPQMHRLSHPQPQAHALSRVPGQGPVRRHRHRRGWLQTCRRGAPQARRHALVRQRRQCHPRPALLHPQRTLRSLLGTTKRRRMRQHLTNLTCTPIRGWTSADAAVVGGV